jgi:hypothetical protein
VAAIIGSRQSTDGSPDLQMAQYALIRARIRHRIDSRYCQIAVVLQLAAAGAVWCMHGDLWFIAVMTGIPTVVLVYHWWKSRRVLQEATRDLIARQLTQ